jgi:hypothetical protein
VAETPQALTVILGRARAGGERARGKLIAPIYDELRQVAGINARIDQPSRARAGRKQPHGVSRLYALQKHIVLVVSMATGLCNSRARETTRSSWVAPVGVVHSHAAVGLFHYSPWANYAYGLRTNIVAKKRTEIVANYRLRRRWR